MLPSIQLMINLELISFSSLQTLFNSRIFLYSARHISSFFTSDSDLTLHVAEKLNEITYVQWFNLLGEMNYFLPDRKSGG